MVNIVVYVAKLHKAYIHSCLINIYRHDKEKYSDHVIKPNVFVCKTILIFFFIKF